MQRWAMALRFGSPMPDPFLAECRCRPVRVARAAQYPAHVEHCLKKLILHRFPVVVGTAAHARCGAHVPIEGIELLQRAHAFGPHEREPARVVISHEIQLLRKPENRSHTHRRPEEGLRCGVHDVGGAAFCNLRRCSGSRRSWATSSRYRSRRPALDVLEVICIDRLFSPAIFWFPAYLNWLILAESTANQKTDGPSDQHRKAHGCALRCLPVREHRLYVVLSNVLDALYGLTAGQTFRFFMNGGCGTLQGLGCRPALLIDLVTCLPSSIRHFLFCCGRCIAHFVFHGWAVSLKVSMKSPPVEAPASLGWHSISPLDRFAASSYLM